MNEDEVLVGFHKVDVFLLVEDIIDGSRDKEDEEEE